MWPLVLAHLELAAPLGCSPLAAIRLFFCFGLRASQRAPGDWRRPVVVHWESGRKMPKTTRTSPPGLRPISVRADGKESWPSWRPAARVCVGSHSPAGRTRFRFGSGPGARPPRRGTRRIGCRIGARRWAQAAGRIAGARKQVHWGRRTCAPALPSRWLGRPQ